MKGKIRKLVPFLLMAIANQSFALGIDKLYAELDASKGFKSVSTLVVFNDESKETVFVTARALKWSLDKDGKYETESTQDLSIYPSVQKIRPGENGAFKIRYNGSPVKSEANYRIYFSQIKLPNAQSIPDGNLSKATEEVEQSVLVGLAMTVPVYVSDFSVKSDLRKQVTATYSIKDGKVMLDVINHGLRHITIKKYRVNGLDKQALGVVLAEGERLFQIESPEPVKRLDLEIASRDDSITLQATEVQQ
ncbi:molecular chaperone [Burkholderia gladioli]|uniref:molecular chaperone n=1 Tax=Burkholderia gladioli TaxID=28095 RepID=UPI00163FA8F2|nr:molecular chaperone [Burkholderia gladioli]